MRARLVLVMLAGLTAPAWVVAQERGDVGGVGDLGSGYAPADPQLPLPLGSTLPEEGLFFYAGSSFGFGWKLADGTPRSE